MTKRLGSWIISGVAAAVLAACGSSSTPIDAAGTPDQLHIDAPPIDAAPPDSGIDAGPAYSGNIAIADISIIQAPTAGHGASIQIDFSQNGQPAEMVVVKSPPSDFPPCHAVLYDVTKPGEPPVENGEGTISFTVTHSGGAPGTSIPPCNYSAAGGGYACASGEGTGGSVVATANPNVATFTATGSTFSSAQVGSYLVLPGTAAFPIVGASGDQLGLAGGVPIAQVGLWEIVDGVGPLPFTANVDGTNPGAAPDFLTNGDTMTVSLAAPASGGHFNSFTTSSASPIAIGESFQLSAASTAILTDGGLDLSSTSPIVLGCDSASGNCGNASGTLVSITTTDATTSPPLGLGAPVKYQAQLLCTSIATDTVSIPANLIAVLKAANPTKLQITVLRVGFDIESQPAPNTVNIVAGHGFTSFQAATAP